MLARRRLASSRSLAVLRDARRPQLDKLVMNGFQRVEDRHQPLPRLVIVRVVRVVIRLFGKLAHLVTTRHVSASFPDAAHFRLPTFSTKPFAFASDNPLRIYKTWDVGAGCLTRLIKNHDRSDSSFDVGAWSLHLACHSS